MERCRAAALGRTVFRAFRALPGIRRNAKSRLRPAKIRTHVLSARRLQILAAQTEKIVNARKARRRSGGQNKNSQSSGFDLPADGRCRSERKISERSLKAQRSGRRRERAGGSLLRRRRIKI